MKRKADFTANEAKQESRLENLQAMQKSYVLWPRHLQRLVDDWVELAGVDSPSVDLISPVLAPQARFIGVDLSRDVIRRCRRVHQGKPAEWVRGDLINLVMNRDRCLEDAGVINFDAFHAPGIPLEEALEILGDFAVDRQQAASHFLLIVNVTSDYKKSPKATIKWVEKHFPRYLEGGNMPSDLSECLYVSKKKPMVNVQVGFGFDPHNVAC